MLRRIFEAYYIYSQKPEINNKSEVQLLCHSFLVNSNVILINSFIMIIPSYRMWLPSLHRPIAYF